MFPTIRTWRTERKDIGVQPYVLDAPVTGGWRPWRRRRRWDIDQAVVDAYERTIWLWKAVSKKAGDGARLTLKYRIRGTDKVLGPEDHPLLRLLANDTKVNALETGRAFKKRLLTQVQLSDVGVFVELTRSRGGDLIRLDLLSPNRVKPVPGDGAELLSHFEHRLPNGNVRRIDRERVWWIRDPHPTDPYRADTQMPALGASVELDDMGRMINVSWMKNDGLTRAIVAVKGDMSEGDMAKLEGRFGRGPVDAGKVSVVTADNVTFADLAGRPRDMQYPQVRQAAKEEILVGLGVPESVIGNASGRTWDNAATEKYNYWSETMPLLLDVVAPELVDPEESLDVEPFFDLEVVEALQLPKQKRREEARAEVAAGLRSIESYAELADIDVYSTEATRALWLPNTGKVQVPQTAADVNAAEQRRAAMEAQMQGAPAQGDAGDGDGDNQGQGQQQGQQPPNPPKAPPTRPDGGNTNTAAGGKGTARPRSAARFVAHKTDATPPAREYTVDLRARDRAEDTAAAALAALAVRWQARTAARLRSPKTRKGTRHWQPDGDMPEDRRAGSKALDVDQVVDPDTWAREATEVLTPLLTAAAGDTATTAVTDLTGQPPIEQPPDTSALPETVTAAAVAGAATTAATAAGAAVAAAALLFARGLAGRLAAADTGGASLAALLAVVETTDVAGWADRIARDAAVSTMEGAAAAVGSLLSVAGWQVTKTWTTRQDGRVRPTHVAAHGQVRAAGQPFTVGAALLRHPRDPRAPLAETAGCRCRTRWGARRLTPATVAAGR